MTATAEAIDNLRKLSESIKTKILEQELHNRVATDKIKQRYSMGATQTLTNATTRVASTRHSTAGVHNRSESLNHTYAIPKTSGQRLDYSKESPKRQKHNKSNSVLGATAGNRELHDKLFKQINDNGRVNIDFFSSTQREPMY